MINAAVDQISSSSSSSSDLLSYWKWNKTFNWHGFSTAAGLLCCTVGISGVDCGRFFTNLFPPLPMLVDELSLSSSSASALSWDGTSGRWCVDWLRPAAAALLVGFFTHSTDEGLALDCLLTACITDGFECTEDFIVPEPNNRHNRTLDFTVLLNMVVKQAVVDEWWRQWKT